MKSPAPLVLAFLALAILAGCAAGSGDAAEAAHAGPLSALVLGFWHGLIAPITLLVEVVHRYVPGLIPWTWRLYEGPPGSAPYDIGFYFGMAGGPSFVIWRRRV